MKTTESVNFTKLFDELPQPYIAFFTDAPHYTIAAQNCAHAKLTFTEPSDNVGKPVLDAFPDNSPRYINEGKSALIESFDRVIQTAEADSMPLLKYDLRDEKGNFIERWWRVTHYPFLNENGEVELVYQTTEDVTEEHHTQQRLQMAETQLESALEVGSVSIWSWDMERDVVYTDKNLAKLFGVDPTTAQDGLPLEIFLNSIHPDDRERVTQSITSSLESKTIYEEEYRVVGSKGEEYWVVARGKAEQDESGKSRYLVGVLFDVTERRDTESELRRIKQSYEAMFESAFLAVCIADLQGNIIDANKTFLKTFEYTKKDLKDGLTSRMISATTSISTTKKIYDELKSNRESKSTEKEYVTKNGRIVPMMVTAIMLPSSDDTFIAFMLDISENKQLKNLNHAKDEFIGMASHQLRTPATIVKQHISLLKDGFAGALTQTQQEFADKAFLANERQLAVVNDMLKTAQLDADYVHFSKEMVNVETLMESVVEQLSEASSAKNQSITIQGKLSQPVAALDENEIKLALVNLLENACKYSPNDAPIVCKLANKGEYISIEIIDKGIGIPDKDISKIFDKFTRAENTAATSVSGTGLGLYWVERIISLHGGKTEVTSTVGKGSTFTVYLPSETRQTKAS